MIPDVEDEIVTAVNICRAKHDYVFTTGGIGPTHDDITAESMAKAFGVALEENAEALAILEEQYRKRNIELNQARRRMANMPAGAELVRNPVSGAPGFRCGNVFVLAGVPQIMQAMLEAALEQVAGGTPTRSRTVIAYLPEGTLAGPLKTLQAEYADIDMGSYPFYRVGRFGSNLVLRGADAQRLDEAVARLVSVLDELGGEPHAED